AVGSILVFKHTRRIPSGHVAVVARIVNSGEILVDHANWYRGTVSRGMSVVDTSPAHDWTSVAVLHSPSGTHGADYPTYGFVYPRPAQREIIEAYDRSGFGDRSEFGDRSGFGYVANGSVSPAPLQLALATEEIQLDPGRAVKTPRKYHRKEAASRPPRKGAAAGWPTHGVARHKSFPARAAVVHPFAAHPRTWTVRTAEAK